MLNTKNPSTTKDNVQCTSYTNEQGIAAHIAALRIEKPVGADVVIAMACSNAPGSIVLLIHTMNVSFQPIY